MATQLSPTTTFHSDAWLFNEDLPAAKRIRILIDIIRRAEKDYLSDDTSWKVRFDAKRVLFYEPWFEKLCSTVGINVDMARLHILDWRCRGKVGDPVFGFLSHAKAYVNYVSGVALVLPTLESLIKGIPSDGRSPRAIPRKPRSRTASPTRN